MKHKQYRQLNNIQPIPCNPFTLRILRGVWQVKEDQELVGKARWAVNERVVGSSSPVGRRARLEASTHLL